MAHQLLLEILKRFFTSGQYSDMEIKDGDEKVYNVHKFILCGFSFFENTMKEGNFKEGLTNVVDLSDDDPAAVKAMLDFMYHGTYTYPDSIDFQGSSLFNLNIFLLSKKYLLNRLGLLEKAWLSTVDLLRTEENRNLVHAALPSAILALYENTPEGENRMRPSYVDVASKEIHKLLKNEEFRNMMDGVGEFG